MTSRAKWSKFMRVITTPIRVLSRARDFYVRSLTNCAGRVTPFAGGYPPIPNSFSVGSSRPDDADDFRELMRATSSRSTGSDPILRKPYPIRAKSKSVKVPISCSVRMASIDEEKPSDLDGEDSVKNSKSPVYPRSRSVAVAARSVRKIV